MSNEVNRVVPKEQVYDSLISSRLSSAALTIPPTYTEILKRLIMKEERGVTHFYGGPLDLDSQNVWLSPVEVDDGNSKSYFQVLYVNARPEEALEDRNYPVSVLDIDETSFKLASANHLGLQILQDQFNREDRHIIIRRSMTGMAYYPEAVYPTYDIPAQGSHLHKLLEVMGFQEPENVIKLQRPSIRELGSTALDSLYDITIRRAYPFAGGEVNLYGIVAKDDPWKYYEIYTPNSLNDIASEDVLIRIDSGCDIGQIYNDKGCDCREQLHTALENIQNEGTGLIVHIPSQDGRGFGMATKMETEGIKRGIQVATNFGETKPVDTVEAAIRLLGKDFDIRTYDGAGKLLASLGINSVMLQTDNRLKLEGLTSAGIKVRRRATQTTGNNGSQHHIAAKHRHSDIYFSHEGGNHAA